MPADVTPMMAQFLSIKNDYQDALLFYRMGDFYELFFDDALRAAETLGITLTKRGKHNGDDIPMCGVPVHSHENYLHGLIKAGFRVAICEQTEDPAAAKKRGSKSVVRREVVRLVTPGTLSEDNLLDTKRHNFLAAYARIRDEAALAWCDFSTGDLFTAPLESMPANRLLARLRPAELLVAQDTAPTQLDELEITDTALVPIARSSFDSQHGESKIAEHFGVASSEAFGQFTRAEIGAMGAILDYLAQTQIEQKAFLRPPKREITSQTVMIDPATMRNLEIIEPLNDARDATLLATINTTQTAIGTRRLAARLAVPLTDVARLNQRFDLIDDMRSLNHSDISVHLKGMADIERAYSRLMLGRAGPRDLKAIGQTLVSAADLARVLESSGLPALQSIAATLFNLKDMGDALVSDLADELPFLARDGGFVRDRQYPELDTLRHLRNDTRQIIAEKQAEYQRLSGVNALKIKHNNVLGYFIETPATHAEKMLSQDMGAHFRHRQTTANALRFSSVALTELETKILSAESEAVAFEIDVFNQWVEKIAAEGAHITAIADAIAEVDIALSMAVRAENQGWVRPRLTTGLEFDIEQGRHPVVEAAIERSGERFVANDCNLSAQNSGRLWLITGPNMAGKSTFLRQNALIVILAQAGFFVPAKSATIGVVDQIFSRVGASDDLARGRSTFMVEMVETAAILNQATEQSLVILDEIGRGTATYDGLAIAWSVLEHLLQKNKSRGLFATHFHELVALEQREKALHAAHIAIKEWKGDIIFMHDIVPGFAERSYGVDVAKLAGLPPQTVKRARALLKELEKQSDKTRALDDLPLFQMMAEDGPEEDETSPVEAMLREVDPDRLSAREALELVYRLVDTTKTGAA